MIKQHCYGLAARFRDIQTDPHYLALGVAIGVFVAATPFFPFHTVIALLLAILLKGSRIAAAAGVWISNPITLPFFYIGTYKTGAFFLGVTSPVDFSRWSFSEILGMGLNITQAMILGGLIIGIILSIIGYFVTLRVIAAFRDRRVADNL